MRQAHNITLILPEGMTLVDFNAIISEVLKESDYTHYYRYDGSERINSRHMDLEAIAGRDVAMEFKKREL